jgi:hypothetical protein
LLFVDNNVNDVNDVDDVNDANNADADDANNKRRRRKSSIEEEKRSRLDTSLDRVERLVVCLSQATINIQCEE